MGAGAQTVPALCSVTHAPEMYGAYAAVSAWDGFRKGDSDKNICQDCPPLKLNIFSFIHIIFIKKYNIHFKEEKSNEQT